MEKRCLACYNLLSAEETDFHERCKKRILGKDLPALLPFSLADAEKYAKNTLARSVVVTGVQPKLSLENGGRKSGTKRLTMINYDGMYIVKTPILQYPEMPELEDLTMHLANVYGIKTAEHSLIRMSSGELAYLTKRFDRNKGGKLPLEDMAQLTGTMTENKYHGSMESVAKVIRKHSSYPLYDLISFFELIIFTFLTGNADMHLKNFALLTTPDKEVQLSPAYDLVPTKLLIPGDKEELALPLRGKKSRFTGSDFIAFAEYLGINPKSIIQAMKKPGEKIDAMKQKIGISFLAKETKEQYISLIEERLQRLTNQS